MPTATPPINIWNADDMNGETSVSAKQEVEHVSGRVKFTARAVILGVMLVVYAFVGLGKFNFKVAHRDEKWIGGIVGLVTGVISAATGVQVIPSMPFMQAIGMEKDELVQALGVFFTVATVALAFNITAAGLLTAATALPGAIAMVASFAGMFIGQAVRSRMQPDDHLRPDAHDQEHRRVAYISMGGALVGYATMLIGNR